MEDTLSKAEKAGNDAVKQVKAKANELAKKGQVILEEQKDKFVGKKA
jgi:hypothetical protein